MHVEWTDRATAIGQVPERLVAATVSPQGPYRGLDDVTRESIVTQALDALTEAHSTWRPAELVRELAAAVPTDVTLSAETLVPCLDQLADEVIAERLVDLSRAIPDGVVLRRDGGPVVESVADRALTTPEILAQEERLIAWAERRLAAGGGDVALDAADARQSLSKPQIEMAAAVAGTRDLLLVVGPPARGRRPR